MSIGETYVFSNQGKRTSGGVAQCGVELFDETVTVLQSIERC